MRDFEVMVTRTTTERVKLIVSADNAAHARVVAEGEAFEAGNEADWKQESQEFDGEVIEKDHEPQRYFR